MAIRQVRFLAENTNDISGRIGLDTTNFKAGIAELNREIRVIDTGFKAAAAGMGDWGASAEGLQSRIDALNQITDLQRKKIEGLTAEYKKIAAEKGADSKAAQDLQIRINKETESLNKNQMELKNTTSALDNFGKEADDAGDKTNKLTGFFEKMGSSLKSAAGAVGKAAVAGIAAIGTAAGAAAVGAYKLATDAGKAADELITLSNKTGISVGQLQEMQYASRFVDVDLEVMTGSMVKLTKSMDAARDGTEASVDAFAELGIQVQNQDGSLRDSKAVWAETINALGNVANETERDALSLQLFGKSAMELNPLIKAGADELKRLGEEANTVGAVLGDDAVTAAGKFDDEMQKMDASLQGFKTTVGVAVMPAITNVVSSITTVIPAIINAVKTGDWAGAVQAVSAGLNGLLQKITGALPGLATMASTIIGGLASAIITAIPQVLPPLIQATVLLLDTLVQVLLDNGPMLISAGVDALTVLIQGIVTALPKLISAAVAIMLALVDGILDALPVLIPAAIQAIVAFATGLINALPRLIDKVPQIVTTIVKVIIDNLPLLIDAAVRILVAITTAIVTNLPLLLKAAVQIIAALVGGIIGALPSLAATVPKMLTAIWNAIREINWGELGWNIITGIADGVTNAAKNLASSVKNAALNALGGVKRFLGIESPSKVFEKQVGLQIGLGLAKGITSSVKEVNAAMAGLNREFTANVNVTGSGGSAGSSVVVNVPLTLDGQVITTATGRIQLGHNQSRSRALGVVPV